MAVLKVLTIASGRKFSSSDVQDIALGRADVAIAPEVMQAAKANFDAVMNMTASSAIYSLTSGVADLCDVPTTGSQDQVQSNILMSHAVGVGESLSPEVTRATIFSRLLVLSKAVSGVSPEMLTFMADILNHDIAPITPSLGSIGASDLTILAGIFVILCGSGRVIYKGRECDPSAAFRLAKIRVPKELRSREGLALINGNNCAIATSTLVLVQLESFVQMSLCTAAMSYEGRTGTNSSFSAGGHMFRPFDGQIKVSRQMEALLKGSTQITRAYTDQRAALLQDPLSFKTVTHVIGNAVDVLASAKKIIEIELNGVTDNPILVTKGSKVTPISSGNYLCTQLATALDQLTLVTANIAQSSVARIHILLNDRYSGGLPKYLIEDNANSGLMIAAYTAQSIMSEIKACLYPRSSISSHVANGWEDLSTNATNTAMNTQKVANLAEEILAIEFALSVQAMALRKQENLKTKFGEVTAGIFERINAALEKEGISLPIVSDGKLREFLQVTRNCMGIVTGKIPEAIKIRPDTAIS